MLRKIIALVTLLFLLQPVARSADFSAWEHDASWNDLTNHLWMCYMGIMDRCAAAGIKAPLSSPSFIHPYSDYQEMAKAIDAIIPSFVCQDKANASGDYSVHFMTPLRSGEVGYVVGATNYPGSFPMWTVSNLHAKIGIDQWSTNDVLHSWFAAGKDIQKQVGDALNLLRVTASQGYDKSVGRKVIHVDTVLWTDAEGFANNVQNGGKLVSADLSSTNLVYFPEEHPAWKQFDDDPAYRDWPVLRGFDAGSRMPSNDHAPSIAGNWQSVLIHSLSFNNQWCSGAACRDTYYNGTQTGLLSTTISEYKDNTWSLSNERVKAKMVVPNLPTNVAHTCQYYYRERASTNAHCGEAADYVSWPRDYGNLSECELYGRGSWHAPIDFSRPYIVYHGSTASTSGQVTKSDYLVMNNHEPTSLDCFAVLFQIDGMGAADARSPINKFSASWKYSWRDYAGYICSLSGDYKGFVETYTGAPGAQAFDACSSRAVKRRRNIFTNDKQYWAWNHSAYSPMAAIVWDFVVVKVPPKYDDLVYSDTDFDDIVETAVNISSFGPDTGSIKWIIGQDKPEITIPLASTPNWYAGIPVHAYLSQGSFPYLPFTYLIPAVDAWGDLSPVRAKDNDGIYQSYSLGTKIVESGCVDEGAVHVKKVVLLRPRGQIVIFEFPYSEGKFSEIGFPISLNANRTYVLRDRTPEYHKDRNYDLHFESGIVHRFGPSYSEAVQACYSDWSSYMDDLGGWEDFERDLWWGGSYLPSGELCSISNSAARVADIYSFSWNGWQVDYNYLVPGCSLPDFAHSYVDDGAFQIAAYDSKYFVVLQYDAQHRPIQVVYTPIGASSPAITTTLNHDDNNIISALAKEGVAGSDARVSQDSGSIEYLSEGAVWMSASLKRSGSGAGKKVIVTRTLPDAGSAVNEYIFNDAERLISAKLIANGASAETVCAYQNSSGRYCSGLPRSSLVSSVLNPDGSMSSYKYHDSCGWLTDVTTSINGQLSRVTSFDYQVNDSIDSIDSSRMVECPRKIETKIGEGLLSKQLFAYDGTSRMIAKVCKSSVADWGHADVLAVTNDYVVTQDVTAGQLAAVKAPLGAQSYTYSSGVRDLTATASSSDGRASVSRINAFGVAEYSKSTEDGCLMNETKSVVDAFGRPTKITNMDGSFVVYANYCLAGPQAVIGSDGAETTIVYYPSGLIKSSENSGTGIKEEYKYDVLGNAVEIVTSAGGKSRKVIRTFDVLGRLTSERTPVSAFAITYTKTATGIRKTTTFEREGSPTLIEDFCLDGSIKEISGSAASAHLKYEYGVNENGRPYTKEIRVAANGGTDESSITVQDMLDSASECINKTGLGGNAVTSIMKDGQGRAIGSVSPIGTKTLSEYDNVKNRVVSSGVKANPAGTALQVDSDDRMQTFGRTVTAAGVINESYVYPDCGSSATQQISSSVSAPDGLSGMSVNDGRTNSWRRTLAGMVGGISGCYSITNMASDGTRTVSEYRKNQLAETRSYGKTGLLVERETRKYDGFGNLEQSWSSTQGTTRYERNPDTDLLERIIPPDVSKGVTVISYVPGTSWVKSRSYPDGSRKSYDYYPNGLLKREFDIGAYDISYEYDSQGRKTRMLTLRDGRFVSTEWRYNKFTGALATKLINGVVVETYKYRDDGSLDSMTDAEGTVLSYKYNSMGDLTNVVVSNGSDGLAAGFDRMGRLKNRQVANGIGENHSLTIDGRPLAINYAGGRIVTNYGVGYSYDPSSAAVTQMLWNVDGVVSGVVGVAYDDSMKVASITSGNISAQYQYTNNTQVSMLSCGVLGGMVLNKRMGWDQANQRLTNIVYNIGSQIFAWAYSYQTNSDRLVQVTNPDGRYWRYKYDMKGQLTNAVQYLANGAECIGMKYGWEYDEIGNVLRAGQMATDGRPMWEFKPDDFNFHTNRIWGSKVAVRGEVGSDVKIAVNGVIAQQAEGRFFAMAPVSNVASAVDANIVTAGVKTNLSPELVMAVTGKLSVAKADERVINSPVGWILRDSMREYRFNAFGWLVQINKIYGTSDERVVMAYYSDGRRAAKSLYKLVNGGWKLQEKHEYYYDAWNLIAESEICYLGSEVTTNVRSYVWGLDLAGQRNGTYGQSAGGIGGFLSMTVHANGLSRTYYPICDHQGTVQKLVDSQTGEIVAEYEYSPYGELLGATGPGKDICPFRYSSKYFDHETGLYYYGFRYYNPQICCWVSRDPLGETGGDNLTLAFGNDPVNNVDAFGLYLVAFDGTGNNKDAKGNAPTNVERLYKGYPANNRHYIRGVGSSDTIIWSILENSSGGLTGLGGDARIEEAWDAVVDHYKDMTDAEIKQDPLDIIGFSRGAALARAFANVVNNRGNPGKFGRVYEWFGKSAMLKSHINVEGNSLPIRFLGIYDTVPSFGKPGNHVDIGFNFKIPDNVQNVRHAISRDESRDLFPLANIATSATRIEQMFPGVHSDVGGGYKDNLDIQYGPLKWMWEEGVKCGVPWSLPRELIGWRPSSGKLKGHQSNVAFPRAHLQAEWDPVSITDKQKRPIWIP